MGVCSSCLGLDRRRGHTDQSETSRLLYDDPHQNQYGSLNRDASHGANQQDPRDIERERKALESIIEQASDNLIDIFALKVQQAFPAAANSKHDHYERLLAKSVSLESMTNSKKSARDLNGNNDQVALDRVQDMDEEAVDRWKIVHNGDFEELIGVFIVGSSGKKAVKGARR
ncbi:MAG: hypothetical protein M1827_007670 [Pycnora praestabilis]|nr:MAG: hypothetical protein M1827_007670 [Pycnora praestabilis]